MNYSKYRAKKTIVDGIKFDSKKEAKRYQELKQMEKLNLIKFDDKEPLQPKFEIKINGKKICTYKADFKYYDCEKMKTIIEDVKGFKTPIYRLKKKLLLACYPDINFLET